MSFYTRKPIQSLQITAVLKEEELSKKGGPGSGRRPLYSVAHQGEGSDGEQHYTLHISHDDNDTTERLSGGTAKEMHDIAHAHAKNKGHKEYSVNGNAYTAGKPHAVSPTRPSPETIAASRARIAARLAKK